ncbi:MAG: flagellar hook-associated protein FlgK, partial [Spirochaetota bacterium]
MPLSTFHSLETAKSSLITHQKSLSVVSHNLANQANEDYSRQKVRLGTLNPVDVPGATSRQGAGQVGQGVEVKEIERIRDTFVDDKIFSQRGVTNYWNIKETYLRSMESVYNEPGGKGVKDLFDNFLSKWNDVANAPTEPGARESLRTSARELTNQINRMYESFTELRNRADEQIRSHISTINSKAKEIAKLNKKIEMVKADGKNPNDLMDRRDALIEDLSGLVNINVTRKDNDFLVFIGSQILVQGDHSRQVTAAGNLSNKGMAQLKWADSGMNINVTDGEIKALMDVRDVDIVNQIKKLDNFAANLTVTVNDIHSEGFGLNGQTGIDFFSFRELSINPNGDYDSNGDGVSDSTAIMKVAGTKKMNLGDTLGIRGTINLGHSNTEIRQINAEIERLSESNNPMDIARRDVLQRRRDELLNTESITVEYFETDTVQDLIDRINASDADVVSYLNHKGQFTIKALHNEQKGQAYSEYTHSPDYAIKHLEDSGHFLTTFTGMLSQQGEDGAFDRENTGSVNAFVTNPDTGAVAVDYDVSPLTNPSSYISLSNDIERD